MTTGNKRRNHMKTRPCVVIMPLVIAAAIALGSLPLYAAEGTDKNTAQRDQDSPGFSIGYNQYYAWWSGRTWVINQITGKEGNKPATGLMYNPVIGIRFNGTVMLSASFAYGQFKYNYDGKVLTDRYDADLLLAITLVKGFKLFLGPKFMRWEQQNTFNSIGLGLGFSYIRSLYKGLFINASISLIAMLDFNLLKSLSEEKKTPGSKKKSGAFVIGTSPSLAFGYYFKEVNITLAAGCRFQYLYYSASINTRSGLTTSSMKSDYIIAPYVGLTYTY
jgi:hypothetical protein